jgi:alpha-tubulin suppressor-like RCC1 family protein
MTRTFIIWLTLACSGIAPICRGSDSSSIIAWGRNQFGQTNVPPNLTNGVAMSCSGYPTCVLLSDMTVVSWGLESTVGPTPAGLSNVVASDSGYAHIMARKDDGTLIEWGYYGGTSNLINEVRVGTPPSLPNLLTFACGGTHDVALLNDGRVVAWGMNSLGQTNVPSDLENVVAIDAGRIHSMALKGDGTVVCWGANNYGQCDVPSGLDNVVAIAAGHYFSIALKSDGTLVGWGDNSFGQLDFPSDLTNIVAVSAGRNHCIARRSDGSLTAWGENAYGQATIPVDLPSVAAFTAGGYHNVVLTGSVTDAPTISPASQTVQAGRTARFSAHANGIGQLGYQWRFENVEVPGATNILLTITNVQPGNAGTYTVVVMDNSGSRVSDPAFLAVAAPPLLVEQPTNQTTHLYGTATFTVRADGASPLYYQWQFEGTNIDGATNATLTFSPASLRQGGAYSVTVSNAFGSVTSSNAMLAMVSVAGWGNGIPVPQNVTNVIAISAGGNSCLALTPNGSILVWGNTNSGIPLAPPELTNIIAISAGSFHGLALRSDRTVVGWPSNSVGPAQVPDGLSNVIAIAASSDHSLALKADMTVVAWGGQSDAQPPAGLSNVVEIAAGGGRSLALKQDGSLVAWGASWGLPRPVLNESNVVAIDVNSFGLALRADGTTLACGGSSAVTNIPPMLTNLTAISAGFFHGLALRADRTVAAWGGYSFGQTNVPVGLTNVVAISAGNAHNLALVTENPAEFAPPQIKALATTNGCTVSFSTRRGWRYRLEYKDSLSDEHWTMLPPIPGDGTVQVATDPNPNPQQRFYRVRQE